MRPEKKEDLGRRRHRRVRKKVIGTPERPRMSVKFTGKNIYVQFIDDNAGRTLAAVSSLSKAVPDRAPLAANVTGATRLGKMAAETAKAKGIEQVVFDRGSARYHGKVKELADAIRKGGDIARQNMVNVSLKEATIPHEVFSAYDGARVLLRPASPGTGVIAGKTVRAVLESAGVKDVLTKSLGSKNAANVA